MQSFDGARKLRARIAAISNPAPTARFDPPAEIMAEQPAGPLYSIYKRAIPAMSSKPVMMALTIDEAKQWQMILVKREQKKRSDAVDQALEHGIEKRHDSIIVFDIVEQGTEQESVYWNPRMFIIGDNDEN